MHIFDVVRRPLTTEKSTLLAQRGQYIFDVARKANKVQIKEAIELAFTVKVVGVNTMVAPAKVRRRGRYTGTTGLWKKAIVTLAEGDRIDLFES